MLNVRLEGYSGAALRQGFYLLLSYEGSDGSRRETTFPLDRIQAENVHDALDAYLKGNSVGPVTGLSPNEKKV